MNPQTYIQSIINKYLPDYQLNRVQSMGGGAMSDIYSLSFLKHPPLVIKIHEKPPQGYFRGEMLGLKALAQAITSGSAADYLRVPQGLAQDEGFILLEEISLSRPMPQNFGIGLARMHNADWRIEEENPDCAEKDYCYGFPISTFCGLSLQDNTWSTDWQSFFWNNRIGRQLSLLHDKGLLNDAISRRFDKFIEKFWARIPKHPRPSLLHGDLWSGNILYSNGQAVLIDPAVYWGHNEADLAFTTLFGQQSESFYQAYYEIFPQEPDWQERFLIYNLYHLLNHANLFHSQSYLGQAIATISRFGC